MSSSLNATEFYNDWATNHLSSVPSQSGPTDDPDSDGAPNLAEYAFGTDPLVSGSIDGAILPLSLETNGVIRVVLFEQAGHRPGVQIDVEVTADLTNWFRPWWLRELTNSLPDDPTNSVRELFTTYLTDTNIFIVRGVIKLIEAGPEPATYYVDPNGSDNASGTSTNTPFRSLAKAVSLASPGNLIYMRGGTYATNAAVSISTSHNGTAANPVRLRAYPGEHPVLDFSSESLGTRGINLSASWWRVYGLEIAGAGDNGINLSGKSNIIERCVFHDCRDTGLQIASPGASNLILNCDAYHNFDPPTGGNADGIDAKLAGLGPDNVFRGCRAWENGDDGYDLYAAPNPVLIDTCWSFRNGFNVINSTNFAGNGIGFKLGGVDPSGNQVPAAHHIVNSLAFNNPHHGIDQNNNSAGLTVDQNTSFNNANKNFNLSHGAVTAGVHVVRNNISFGNGNADTFDSSSILISNSWQVLASPPGTNDFLSMDSSWALAPRRDDGGLPETPFMRPVPGGRLVDQGTTNVGAAFYGSAPDLGAFETPAW